MKHILLSVLVLSLLLVPAERGATAQTVGSATSPTGSSPRLELPPDDCFDAYIWNAQFCKALYCEDLWFLWWDWTSCDDGELLECLADAQAALAECLAGQDS